jgi:hypothetical protein
MRAVPLQPKATKDFPKSQEATGRRGPMVPHCLWWPCGCAGTFILDFWAHDYEVLKFVCRIHSTSGALLLA